jgi:hypothetical protein
MQKLEVTLLDERARPLLELMEEGGMISVVDKDDAMRRLGETMKRIRASVKDKMTVKEVIAEVDAVRAKRYAAARKPKARRGQ